MSIRELPEKIVEFCPELKAEVEKLEKQDRRRITSPENSPYRGSAASRLSPESIMRLRSITESTNWDRGTMHALMVMGMAMRVRRPASIRPL